MEYTRILKRYKTGEDVMAVKQRLKELGYLEAATKNIYGDDTYKAVKLFQSANNLEADGIVGQLTWNALFACSSDNEGDSNVEPNGAVEIPSWYSAAARVAIGAALANTSKTRRKICLEALKWAVDASAPTPTLKGFYIRGANSYNTNLSSNIMTKAALDSYFKKPAYAPYYDNGRMQMMMNQCAKDGYNKLGADCSGFIVGLWRKFKIKSNTFDANANSLYGSYCTQTSNPQPGDLAWKSGHIGIYVGGGYVVEAAGGAYGIQLTKVDNRKCYNYVTKKLSSMGKWTAFGDPKGY